MCDARIRPFPTAALRELACELDHVSVTDGTEHEATIRDMAFQGSRTTVTWFESDRRTYRGPWSGCATFGCVLPAGHRGSCAA